MAEKKAKTHVQYRSWGVLVTSLTLFVVASEGAAAASGKLDELFQSDILGAQQAFLEHITGPAWRVLGRERIYKVDGCIVTVGFRAGEVRYLGLVQVSPICTFRLKEFVPNSDFPPPATMRFGDFDNATYGGGVFQSSCIFLCGNAADPVVYEYWKGPHSDNFIEVRIGAVLVNGIALDAASSWSDAMKASSGEAYVINTKFNCDLRYHPLAHKLFTEVQVTTITVGFDLPNVSPRPCR